MKYEQPKPVKMPKTYDGMKTPPVKEKPFTARGSGAARPQKFSKNG